MPHGGGFKKHMVGVLISLLKFGITSLHQLWITIMFIAFLEGHDALKEATMN